MNRLSTRRLPLRIPSTNWSDRNEDWAQLRSDLSVAVNDALAREKIAIA
jgi:hypothetical protein